MPNHRKPMESIIIPTDLLPHILSYLSLDQILRFHFQNVQIFQLLKQNPYFWDSIYERELATPRNGENLAIRQLLLAHRNASDSDASMSQTHRHFLICLNQRRQLYRTLTENAIPTHHSQRFRTLELDSVRTLMGNSNERLGISLKRSESVAQSADTPQSSALVASCGKLVLHVLPLLSCSNQSYNLQLYDVHQCVALGAGLTHVSHQTITHVHLYRGKEEREWYAMLVSQSETVVYWIGEYSGKKDDGLSMRHVGTLCLPSSSNTKLSALAKLSAVTFLCCDSHFPHYLLFVDSTSTLHVYNPFYVRPQQEEKPKKCIPRYMQGTTAHRSRSFKIQNHTPLFSIRPPNVTTPSEKWCNISSVLHEDKILIAFSSGPYVHYCTLDETEGLSLRQSQRLGSTVHSVRLSLEERQTPQQSQQLQNDFSADSPPQYNVKASIVLKTRCVLVDVVTGTSTTSRLMEFTHMISTLGGGVVYANPSFTEFRTTAQDNLPATGYIQQKKWNIHSLQEKIRDVTLVYDAPDKSIWMIIKDSRIDFVLCTSVPFHTANQNGFQTRTTYLKSAPMPHYKEGPASVQTKGSHKRASRKVTHKIVLVQWENLNVLYIVKTVIRTQENTSSHEEVRWSLNVYSLGV
uniref:F-box domain-containing protein n=1 Tax=Percolomonas cosmopolitus TaxID=63605 RepID=A0A7S1KPN0_9EUKA